ncbi:MAG TPA: hypothetical protein VMS09_17495 [Paenibacillus sp.]|uniref:hypothetical protein n=1 Tax=Paenibacillus sp. TaxID=58172 RepID=UPI002CECDA9A|nr:hypothetical protein [Paenibacillus sp.]HUC93781.1 hypothetical protein [Paenibacillus sp.]
MAAGTSHLSQVFVACRDGALNSLDALFIRHFEERINSRTEFGRAVAHAWSVAE